MILLLGDTHGNTEWVQYVVERAANNGYDTILQLGDYGHWEHVDKGAFGDATNAICEKFGIMFYWLDGNHENHPHLWTYYKDTDEQGFIKYRQNVRYIPRGHTWTWGGKKFLAMGGAYSVDRYGRKAGQSWWPTELIRDLEVDTAIEAGKVDILVTHDGPRKLARLLGLGEIPECSDNQLQLETIANYTKPSLWFHGHFHVKKTYLYEYFDAPQCTVDVLDCDVEIEPEWDKDTKNHILNRFYSDSTLGLAVERTV